MRADVIDFGGIDVPHPHTLRHRHEEYISECLRGEHGDVAQETMKLLKATIHQLECDLDDAESKITKIEDCEESPG